MTPEEAYRILAKPLVFGDEDQIEALRVIEGLSIPVIVDGVVVARMEVE